MFYVYMSMNILCTFSHILIWLWYSIIVVVGVLLHFVCDLKATQVNMQQSNSGTYALGVQTGP